MINKVKAWLEDGTVDVFLGYKEIDHHPLPHCFTRERIEEVADLVLSPARYALENRNAYGGGGTGHKNWNAGP